MARIIEFESDSQAINTYNSQIENMCQNLNQLLVDVLNKHPELKRYDTHLLK